MSNFALGTRLPPGVLIVANPYSGSLANRHTVEALAEMLTRRGLKPSILWHRAERTAALAEADLAQRFRCIVAAGGDGTLSAVIHERRDLPLAVLPLGTENLFARQLGYARDPEALAAAICRCTVRELDLADANGRSFSLMLSAGFDAEVVRRHSEWRSRGSTTRRGHYVNWARPVFGALCGYHFPRIHVEADGATITGAAALVFNFPRYSLNVRFAPEAQPDDGLLDWVVLQRPGRRALLSYFLAVRRGAHLARPGVRHGRARRIVLRSEKPAPIQIDGDAAGFTPVNISVQPKALRVVSMQP